MRSLWYRIGAWFGRHPRVRLPLTALVWVVCELLGGRAIWQKICPPEEGRLRRRRPATFGFWVIGVYAALYAGLLT